MEKNLQMAEEDMQKLSKMNETLFASWQDKMSDHFSKGCLNEMERQWKQYMEAVNPLLRQIKKIEEEMTEYHERSKRR
jgi:hypothetical protein